MYVQKINVFFILWSNQAPVADTGPTRVHARWLQIQLDESWVSGNARVQVSLFYLSLAVSRFPHKQR